MSDEDLEQEDIEGVDVDGDEDEDEDDREDTSADDSDVEDGDGDDDDEGAVAAPRAKSKAKVVVEEDLPSVEAKQGARDELAQAMEAFLARGGKVQEIDPNVVSDPPKKPDSKYGSRPI